MVRKENWQTPIPQIIQALSPGLAGTILKHVQTEAKDTFAAVMAMLSDTLKYRPGAWKLWPKERQREWLFTNLQQNRFSDMARQLLQEWFFSQRVGMLNQFLDALDIPRNEDGCITGEVPGELDEGKVRDGTEVLLKNFPAEEVALYLHLFQYGKKDGWMAISGLLHSDKRLCLGPAAS